MSTTTTVTSSTTTVSPASSTSITTTAPLVFTSSITSTISPSISTSVPTVSPVPVTTGTLTLSNSSLITTTVSSFSVSPATSVTYTVTSTYTNPTTPVSKPSLKSRFTRLFSPKSTSSPDQDLSSSKLSSSDAHVSALVNQSDLDSPPNSVSPNLSTSCSSTATLTPISTDLEPPVSRTSLETSLKELSFAVPVADTNFQSSTASCISEQGTISCNLTESPLSENDAQYSSDQFESTTQTLDTYQDTLTSIHDPDSRLSCSSSLISPSQILPTTPTADVFNDLVSDLLAAPSQGQPEQQHVQVETLSPQKSVGRDESLWLEDKKTTINTPQQHQQQFQQPLTQLNNFADVPQLHSPSVTTADSSVPLWKLKDPSASSNDINNIEVDPVNMYQLLVCLVNKLDGLSASYDELDSRTNIMQNSLFTVLNNKIDNKLSGLADTIKKCTDSQAKLDENLQIASQNNADTRRFLEDHLRGSQLNHPRTVNNRTSSDDITSDSSLDALNTSPVEIKLQEL